VTRFGFMTQNSPAPKVADGGALVNGWVGRRRNAPHCPSSAASGSPSRVMVLAQLGPEIQWVESFVAGNKTFCVYLAASEDLIRKHAEISGFPASKITLIERMIDPTTAA
jgi:Protein of unknown function (DUF4242)